ncbi:MAG: heterodisulfide reductase subunit A, partial [Gammaproteobacteria bacterium]
YRVSIRLNPRFVNSNCTACGDCAQVPCSEYLGDSASESLSGSQQGAYPPHPLAYPQRYVIDPRLLATADAEKVREACAYGAIDLEQRSEEITLNVGSVIWAAGGEPFDARRIQAYGAGRYADVISSMDFERMMSPTGPTAGQLIRPSDGREARNIAFIQCAGSRDANYLRHCSGMCCMASLRQASHVMDARGDNAQVSVYYIDMRLSGPFEAIYRQFHEDPRIRFIRSKVAEVVRDEAGNPVCRGVDTEGGGHYENVHDLVVLAVGLEPRIPEGVLPDGVSVNEGGFIESGGVNGGFFAAGVCAEAMDYQGALRSASAAALKAIQVVKRSALAG